MLSIALVQMNIQLGEKEFNLAHAAKQIEYAIQEKQNIDYVLLPELFTTGYASPKNLEKNAEYIPTGKTCKKLHDLAQKYDTTIFGSIAERTESLPYNTLLCVTPKGIQATYRKIHLFKLMGEHKLFQAGNEIVSVDLSQGKIGLQTCYDIRFPEISRILAIYGVHILIIVAEFPRPRENHWKTLLQARAIENQCFVLAVNRVGSDTDNTFFGMSMAVSPTGKILNELSTIEQTIFASIDLKEIEAFRKKIPCLSDRRKDLYRFY